MDEIVEALQGIVMPEPETEAQPDPTQSDGDKLETQLTQEISELWSSHVSLTANHKTTVGELRQIRAALAERLSAVKNLLARPGRGGEWRGWLRQRAIPRSTADRLVSRYVEMLGSDNEGNVLSGAISQPGEPDAEKLANNVWQRVGKLLTTGESTLRFINRIAELSGVGHERHAEGLMIFIPVPEVTNELPGSVPVIDPVTQAPDEAPPATEEPTNETGVIPTELGLAVAPAESGTGIAA